MGQQVVALMYGIKKNNPQLIGPNGEDYFWDDFSQPEEKRLKWDDERKPRSAYEGDIVGFSVASGPGMDDSEGFLGHTTSLSNIEEVHKEHVQKAKERWERFAKWAKEQHGKDFPTPQLYLTTDERA